MSLSQKINYFSQLFLVSQCISFTNFLQMWYGKMIKMIKTLVQRNVNLKFFLILNINIKTKNVHYFSSQDEKRK